MNLKKILQSIISDSEDRAVSPVIGVILMVAITVILAAVIGTFVLGLGDRVSQASPSATFAFEYHTDNHDTNYVNITHDGGDGVESSQVNVSVGGNEAYGPEGTTTNYGTNATWDGKLTAGSTVEINDAGNPNQIQDGNSVKVIWTASGSDKTAVIGESEVDL